MQQEEDARIEAERKKMSQMLAPHLQFPPDMYPVQTLDQVYGANVVYAPGMPPVPQYGNVAPAYSYGSGGAPFSAQKQPQQSYMPPQDAQQPQMGTYSTSGNSAPFHTPQTGRAGDGGNVPFSASQGRVQSWPTPGAGPSTGSNISPPVASALPLAPSVNVNMPNPPVRLSLIFHSAFYSLDLTLLQ